MSSTRPTVLQLRTTIHDLRSSFGFYPDHSQSDDAILQQIQVFYGSDWPSILDDITTPAAFDMLLLWPDQSRVWCRDLEGVYFGENAYAVSLREWAAISRGHFAPEHISENWLSAVGPVHITFTVHGQTRTFIHHNGQEDFLRLEILKLINGQITDPAYRFAAADNYPGDCRFVVVLHHEEKERLQHTRGWVFCDFLV